MALSYEFSIGSVRAREKSLFTSADIEQLRSYKSVDDVRRFLIDKGYGDGSDIDEIIADHTEKVWDYLKSVAPDITVFDPFFLVNDVHNFKVTLKGTMSGRKYDELIAAPNTIDPEVIKQSVEHKKFSLLPDWLAKPAQEAYDIIATKGDARESDAVVDKAVMQETLRITEEFSSDFLKQYFRTQIFYNNIKIALRSSRTGVTADYLNKAFCDVAEFRKASVISAALKGSEALTDELSKYSEYDCSRAMEKFRLSPTLFEKFVDDRLILLAKESCKRTSEGAEPIIGYYLGCEAEKKVIHIITSGIRTNTETETIRERLREIYG